MSFDTIAAISTPIGEAGLAVVRVSGPAALKIADQIFEPGGSAVPLPSEAPSHTVHYGRVTRDGKIVDEVMLTVLLQPRTFTREDMIEITCHGGVLPAKLVLDSLLRRGARLAEAGEFTKRAFLNGRIDLTQAEAIADLIHSRSELALEAANEQLAGNLSKRIETLRDGMIQVLAHVEAHIDFPDEDIAPDTKEKLMDRLANAVHFMDELLRTASDGQILRRGVRAAIIGRPNAGKSSLLNQLLGHERAIVSEIPGTTRDTIEEMASIRGIPVVFVDTAGLRDSTDVIEVEGIRRSRQSFARAEIILHVLDNSTPLSEEDQRYIEEFSSKRRIIVRNKMDLLEQLALPCSISSPVAKISCSSGEGLENLKEQIKDLVWTGGAGGEMHQAMINSRHQEALERARRHTLNTLEALRENRGIELAAMDLRLATNAVGEIVGKTTTEDLLDSIFSQFCLGK